MRAADCFLDGRPEAFVSLSRTNDWGNYFGGGFHCCTPGLELSAAEIVLEAHDAVLAEIGAALHLDEDQVVGGGILDAVGGPDGNVDRFAGAHHELADPERRGG